jgi:hypothetical protein
MKIQFTQVQAADIAKACAEAEGQAWGELTEDERAADCVRVALVLNTASVVLSVTAPTMGVTPILAPAAHPGTLASINAVRMAGLFRAPMPPGVVPNPPKVQG